MSKDRELAPPTRFVVPEKLINTKQAAELIGQSTSFLEQDRVTKRHGVPYIKIGSSVRYRPSDIEAWLLARRVSCGSAQ